MKIWERVTNNSLLKNVLPKIHDHQCRSVSSKSTADVIQVMAVLVEKFRVVAKDHGTYDVTNSWIALSANYCDIRTKYRRIITEVFNIII